MITVLTGTPGNGKTAHAIDLLYFDKGSMYSTLDKYVDGVADLKLEHFDFPTIRELKADSFVPLSEVDSDEYKVWLPDNPDYPEYVQAKALARTPIELWYLWATPNSVIMIDEAQRYFRPRPAGSPVPFYIRLLEYHRHFGIHFLLVTQKERLLHSNVRALAGQHIHLTDGWRGRHRFEWPEVKDSDSKSEKQASAHSEYKLPVHVFPYYKSAVTHLKVSHKLPMYRKVMYAALLVIPLVGWISYKNWVKPAPDKAVLDKKSPVAIASDFSVSGVVVTSEDGAIETENYLKQFEPVVPSRPESAHAYDAIRQVVSMPRIAGCVSVGFRCRCYSQQGSYMPEISDTRCSDILKNGDTFNPYLADSDNAIQAVGSAPSVAPSDASKVRTEVTPPLIVKAQSARPLGMDSERLEDGDEL